MGKPRLHSHYWRLILRADGCHWWMATYTCECGSMRRDHGERDRYDAMFLISENPTCPRCKELADGATPAPSRSGVEPATSL